MRTLAFDTETYLIQPGNLTPKPVCFTAYDGENEYLLSPADGAKMLEKELAAGTTIVGQNVAFDFGVMLAAFPRLVMPVFEAYERGQIKDTKIRQQLIYLAYGWLSYAPDRNGEKMRRPRYSLDELVMEHFSTDISASKKGEDVWRLRYHELDGVPFERWPKIAKRYAIDDAVWTYRIYQKQKKAHRTDIGEIADKEGNINDEHKQTKAAFWLHLSSCWGLRTCPERVANAEIEIRAFIKEYEAELVRAGVMRETGAKDMEKIKRRVVDAYSGEPPLTPTGAPKADRETFKNSGDAILEKLAEFSAVQKLDSTYLPVLKSGTEYPINPGYNVLLETGRTSSFRPNIQNLPRKGGVRECFTARPGRVFIKCDYDQFELRVFAEVCLHRFGFSKMADAFFDNKDPHVIFAAQVIGIDYETAYRAYKNPDEPYHKQVKDYRQNYAKAANFGFIGGMGPNAIQKVMRGYGTEVSIEFCRQLHEDWKFAWPEATQFFQWHHAKCAWSDSYTHVTPFSTRQRGDANYPAACNNDIQGPAACAAKNAGWQITRKAYTDKKSALYGSRIVAFVHDEFIIETPERKASEAALELSDVMNRAASEIIKTVPIKSEPCIMRYWDKNAEPTFDNNGRLVLWQP